MFQLLQLLLLFSPITIMDTVDTKFHVAVVFKCMKLVLSLMLQFSHNALVTSIGYPDAVCIAYTLDKYFFIHSSSPEPF